MTDEAFRLASIGRRNRWMFDAWDARVTQDPGESFLGYALVGDVTDRAVSTLASCSRV